MDASDERPAWTRPGTEEARGVRHALYRYLTAGSLDLAAQAEIETHRARIAAVEAGRRSARELAALADAPPDGLDRPTPDLPRPDASHDARYEALHTESRRFGYLADQILNGAAPLPLRE